MRWGPVGPPLRRLVLVPLAATLGVRLALALLLPITPAWDGVLYARLAAHLAAGDGYVISAPIGPSLPTAFYPVGYPAAVAALVPITRSVPVAARAVNLLAAALACLSAVALGRHLGGPRAGHTAGLGYALYPGAVLWSAATMTETLNGALLAAACAAALVPRARRNPWLGPVLSAVLTAAATLVRPQSLLAAPLAGALGGRGGLRSRALRAAAVTAIALALVAPWTARNARAVGGCALVSTNGGSNLLIGTFPEVRGGYRRPTRRDGCGAEPDEFRRDRCMSALAVQHIRVHPLAWVEGGLQKLARTFLWEHDPVTYLLRAHPGVGRPVPFGLAVAVCTTTWWALVLLAVRGARRAGAAAALPVAVTLAVAATHAVFLGADRYHLALVPLLVPLAAVGLSTLWAPRRT